MNAKRIIELSFIAIFAVGVGISLLIHQTYDEWLTRLVEASGRRVAGGPLVLQDLKWQAGENSLSISQGQWFDDPQNSAPWLLLPAGQWRLPADSWQGAQFYAQQIKIPGMRISIRQEGLSTNLNRLIHRLETVTIEPEKLGRGKEPLLFKIDQLVFSDIQVELTTLKHGVLRWTSPELTIDAKGEALAFDLLLQRVTGRLLAELKLQATQQMLTITPAGVVIEEPPASTAPVQLAPVQAK